MPRIPRELGVSASCDDEEVGVKLPRMEIAWVMFVIAIAAFDLTAIRAFLDYNSPFGDELLMGALPMSNVLAVGLLIGQRRRGSSPFLMGFETFGALALASCVALTISFPRNNGPIYSYMKFFIDPIAAVIGQDRPFVLIPIACSVAVLMVGLPQVAIALTGGYVFRWLSRGGGLTVG
jgi:hypothetical protein